MNKQPRRKRPIAIALAALVMASGLVSGNRAEDEPGSLQGTWKVVAINQSGRTHGEDRIKRQKPLIIANNEWRAPSGVRFTFKTDTTTSPHQLDLHGKIGGQEGVWRGIYRIQGDTLTFCRSYDLLGERPKVFQGGAGLFLMVCKRVE